MKTLAMMICGGFLLAGASGCSLAPKYGVPSAPQSSAFKEALTPAEVGTWQTAMPADGAARGEWWKVFKDSQLDDLEGQALAANQKLAAAAARVQEARAIEGVTGAARFPNVAAGFGPSRQQNASGSLGVPASAQRPDAQTVWRAQANISYEVDLFGRVASTVRAAHADTQQSEALFRSVQLALQADVAQNYFNLRELDAEQAVYRRAVELRTEALTFVQHRAEAGEVSDLEWAQAKAELASATSDAMTLERQRAASEHALAVLLGKPPSEFAVAPRPLEPVAVAIPPGMPSSLLERRPDIAAAERAMAAENARIGVARAAYFPSLVLTGTGGYESSAFSDLFKWSSRSFLLGPLVGTAASMPIFDGGVRKGNLANAKARYDESVARYRQQVLVAFQEVEDNLVNLRILENQTRVQGDEVAASARAAELSKTQYEDGSAAYINVIDTERVVLQGRLTAVRLRGVQATSTVNLIRTLGGGWEQTVK
ncbi:multidrug efflux system outer membrane protein [Luteibacter sp. OK325]|uniref:efflux transporter outer membrane subunit n=1 Tax=Luteibacter sp. OK325 TaxID=2135670 RepID=UPI000D395C9A|nr:efflux transporter outer membrane subunit [Luteibacter sp. OK325]PTR34434.1 multidrug efflux system outer membrane protein [Luteibacter sp. OK325]